MPHLLAPDALTSITLGATPDPVVPTTTWPEWPGINVATGLALCGSETLLRNSLGLFLRHYHSHADLLRGLAREGRLTELARQAHTFKGVAKQLGMPVLAEAATALEHALAGNPPLNVTGLTDQVAMALAQVVTALAGEPPGPTVAVPSVPAAAPLSPMVLDDLRDLLTESDSQALAHWQSQRDAMVAALPAQMAEALAQCDLDAAQPCPPKSLPPKTP